MFRQYMKKVSILNLNKHIEKKTLFLVFVQSPAVSLNNVCKKMQKLPKLFTCDGRRYFFLDY